MAPQTTKSSCLHVWQRRPLFRTMTVYCRKAQLKTKHHPLDVLWGFLRWSMIKCWGYGHKFKWRQTVWQLQKQEMLLNKFLVLHFKTDLFQNSKNCMSVLSCWNDYTTNWLVNGQKINYMTTILIVDLNDYLRHFVSKNGKILFIPFHFSSILVWIEVFILLLGRVTGVIMSQVSREP